MRKAYFIVQISHLKIGLLALFSFCFFAFGNTQSTNPQTKLPNVFPANPKAFEFLKYTEVPVGKYTGVPSIEVPVYNIRAKGLDIPISVSYHSNGFRVSEEAGWTGLGWTLQTGGSIVQVVNGFDDFGWYRHRDNELDGLASACNVPATTFDNAGAADFLLTNNPPKAGFGAMGMLYPYSWNSQLTDGLRDIKPDVFKFNVLGYSGEFLLDWENETFKCISDHQVKIIAPNYTNNPSMGETPPGSFKVIMPDGNQFIFTLKEETITSGVANYTADPVPYLEHLIGSKSSRVYQLTSIYSNGGDLVSFNYIQTAELENLPAISHSFTYQEGAEGVFPIPYSNNPLSTTVNYSRQTLSYLSSIQFPSGSLVFNSTSDRIDFNGMRKLNSIELKDFNNTTVNSFNFSYDYFAGHTLGNNTDNYLDAVNPVYHCNKTSAELTHRLKLLSITESGKPPYVFEYDQSQLPKKTSLATDNWGFYNAKTSNINFMPNIYMTGVKDINLVGIQNNKNSSLEGTKSAVLTKVTYPTGGASSFEYELNAFENFRVPDDQHSTISSVFLNDRNNPGDNPAQIFSADVPSALYAGTYNISTYGPMSSTTNSMSAYIRLTILQKTAANIALTNTPATFWPLYYTTPIGQLSTQINGVVSDSKILQFAFNPTTQQYETFKLAENQFLAVDPEYIYIIQAYLDNSFGPQSNGSQGANASVYFTFLRNMSHSISYGAGLRVKNIQTKDPVSPPLIKSYEYNGGKLMSPLLYLTNCKIYYNPLNGSTDPLPIYKTDISSSSFLSPSTNASGKYVGYNIVSEMNSSINPSTQAITHLQGKIIDHYTNNTDKGSLGSIITADPATYDGTWPYIPFLEPREYLNFIAPMQKANIQNGMPMITRIYDANESLLEETINEWDYVLSSSHTYSRVSTLNLRSATIPIAGGNYLFYCVGFYPLVSTKTILKNSTKKTYSSGNLVSTYQQNNYDSYNQLSYSTITDSKQQTRKTTYRYPYNFPEYSSMATYNISAIIEKKDDLVTTSGTVPISTIKNIYTGFTSSSGTGVWDITAVHTSIGTGTPTEEIAYELYGSYTTPEKHKLLQYRDKSGVINSIVWGYGGQYPVAKISGKGYNEAISQSGIDLLIVNNTQTSDIAMRSELNKLRQLQGCFIITYTYKPLVGQTSETDPRGRTTYYEYDNMNRLSVVKDHDGKVIKKICYNYAGQPENCLSPCTNTTAEWQNTATALRCQLNAGQNTGYQEQEQKDINPCSSTYNQLRWVQTVYNTTACPLPAACNSGNCSGNDKKCINGVCETGVWVVISATRETKTSPWTCVWAYCFSDGSYSTYTQTTTSSTMCAIGCF